MTRFSLPAADPDKDLTPDDIRDAHDALGELLCLLPELGLSADDRKALAAYLFVEGPTMVLRVVSAMRREPGLFADEPVRGADLDLRLDRAYTLRNLERILLAAARRAGALALRDHAGAVKDAMAVLRRSRLAQEEDRPRSYARACCLRSAQDLLDKRNDKSRKGRQQRARDRKQK